MMCSEKYILQEFQFYIKYRIQIAKFDDQIQNLRNKMSQSYGYFAIDGQQNRKIETSLKFNNIHFEIN